jgi:peptidoglycan hydrolase-like protein with peptidoglycan-binding domain
MARTVFGMGSLGELINNVETQLASAGFDTSGIDGDCGPATAGRYYPRT